MVKQLISDRLKFANKEAQALFILNARNSLNLSNAELAKVLNVSQRTIADWIRVKFNMSHIAAKRLMDLSGVSIPRTAKVISWDKHLQTISKKGGDMTISKYGKIVQDESYRKDRWNKWWNETGKHNKKIIDIQTSIKVVEPKHDGNLAEFVGIMLGDGGISKYFIKVTLNKLEVDYIKFVSEIILKLFKTEPKLHYKKNSSAVDIYIYRKQVVDFCKKIGMHQGSKIKQQVDIPSWIKADQDLLRSCLRGLVDTDGCYYYNTYLVGAKKYTYLKIAFTNESLPLLNSFKSSLLQFGIKGTIDKNKHSVRISDANSVAKFISEIGSSNSKHIERMKL